MRYSLLLTTDPILIEAAQRLRHDVFTHAPGFALSAQGTGMDVDRFDEHCDHLLVREENSGELVGCYRMLSPTGADPDFGVYDFPAVLDRRLADTRCLRRLRSVSAAAEPASRMA